MSQLSVGVIGLGMGRAHIRGYQSHPKAVVVAVADPDAQRLRDVGEEFGVAKRYPSAEAMFENEKLDVVSIAVPNVFHRPLTLLAFEHGCHVLCEKPMAMNASEAREMLDAAQRADRRLMINFSFRFTPQSQALKREVESGVLGEIYYGRSVWHRRRGIPRFGGWFGQRSMSGGGPLIDLGVHRLDLALWLMGYPEPEWVMGGTYNHVGSALARTAGVTFDVEDLAVAMIRFRNGTMLELEASWAANIAEKELMSTQLLGSHGGLVQRNVDQGYGFEAEVFFERGGSQYDMKLSPVGASSPAAMHHFIECIVTDTPHSATGSEGLLVMSLLDAIYESGEKGRPIQISS